MVKVIRHKAASLTHMDGSPFIFARWHQMPLKPKHWSTLQNINIGRHQQCSHVSNYSTYDFWTRMLTRPHGKKPRPRPKNTSPSQKPSRPRPRPYLHGQGQKNWC